MKPSKALIIGSVPIIIGQATEFDYAGAQVGGEKSKYTIILEPNYPKKGYTVRVPALSGCITYGRNREEALARAREAIEGFIEGLEKAGEPSKEGGKLKCGGKWLE